MDSAQARHEHDHVIIEDVEGVHVVRFLTTELFDILVISQVEAQIRGGVELEAGPSVVLALEAVQHMSSAMLSVLVSLRKDLDEAGGKLCLAAVPERLAELMKSVRFDKLFDSHTTVDEAVAALS